LKKPAGININVLNEAKADMSVKVQAVRGQSESMLMIESGPKVFDKALLQGMMRSKTESGDIEMASIEED